MPINARPLQLTQLLPVSGTQKSGNAPPKSPARRLLGLRYTATTRLRELGVDWVEIGAITGNQTAEMARKYSNQRRAAKVAIARLNAAGKKGGGTQSV